MPCRFWPHCVMGTTEKTNDQTRMGSHPHSMASKWSLCELLSPLSLVFLICKTRVLVEEKRTYKEPSS